MLEPNRWIQFFPSNAKTDIRAETFLILRSANKRIIQRLSLKCGDQTKVTSWHWNRKTSLEILKLFLHYYLEKRRRKKSSFHTSIPKHLLISTNNISQLINSQALTNINLNMCRHIVTAGARLKPKCIVATVFPLIHILSYYGMKYEKCL